MDSGSHPALGPVEALNIVDRAAVRAAIARWSPTHVVNLAGLAAPAAARANPRAAWDVHVHGVLNLADAIMAEAPQCWLLNIGSGLVYGDSAKSGLPLDETALLAPGDDYSVTKAAGDLALGALARRGLRCLRLRPFNHTGAGQTENFVVPAFAMQIAKIEAGLAPPTIRVGNLEAERDFLDVGDVVEAYALAVQRTGRLESGTILNIASGIPRRIGDILENLLSRSRIGIAVERDAARMNPSDLPRVVGDASRARERLSWVPKRDFDETLATVLDDCRSRVAQD
jgi:GDP-4-dehydro-6-deoxy-D-mannose reductase